MKEPSGPTTPPPTHVVTPALDLAALLASELGSSPDEVKARRALRHRMENAATEDERRAARREERGDYARWAQVGSEQAQAQGKGESVIVQIARRALVANPSVDLAGRDFLLGKVREQVARR